MARTATRRAPAAASQSSHPSHQDFVDTVRTEVMPQTEAGLPMFTDAQVEVICWAIEVVSRKGITDDTLKAVKFAFQGALTRVPA